MKTLIFGSRDAKDYDQFIFAMGKIYTLIGPITSVVAGDADGIDSFALRWAESRDIPCVKVSANFKSGLGGIEGPARNERIHFEHSDIGLAIRFPGGRGTADMTKRCVDRDIPMLDVARLLKWFEVGVYGQQG